MTVKLLELVRPALFVASTLTVPGEVVAPEFQSYVTSYGEEVTSPPPVIPVRLGNVSFWMEDSPSPDVAAAAKLALFVPPGL